MKGFAFYKDKWRFRMKTKKYVCEALRDGKKKLVQFIFYGQVPNATSSELFYFILALSCWVYQVLASVSFCMQRHPFLNVDLVQTPKRINKTVRNFWR